MIKKRVVSITLAALLAATSVNPVAATEVVEAGPVEGVQGIVAEDPEITVENAESDPETPEVTEAEDEENVGESYGKYYEVDGVKGGRIRFDTSTGTVTGFESGVTQADIPEKIDGVAVTAIRDWVGKNSDIAILSIPSSVTTLGEGVFYNSKITDLTIPGSIKVIPKNSFSENQLLKSVSIENGVTEIGDYCFTYCEELETLSMPGTLKKIGQYSFRECFDLENVFYDGRTDFYPFDGGEKNLTLGEGCFDGALFGHPDFSDSYKKGNWYRQLHSVTPTGNYLNDLMAIAESQLGYHEGNSLSQMNGNFSKAKGDYAEYNYWWNEPGSKWCGEYAAWCIAMASIPYEIIEPKYNTMDDAGKKRNFSWEDTAYAGGDKGYELKKGDVILFKYKNGNHVVIVEAASSNGSAVTVETINGNHSNDVSYDTYTINASTGKTTDCWTDINGHVDTIYSPDFSIASHLTYHTVNFDMQGGNASWSSKKLTNNAYYGLMPLPVKSGHTFDGWFTEPSGGKKITSYRRVHLTGDETLYAHWTEGGSTEESEDGIDTSDWEFDSKTGTITWIPKDWTGGKIPSKIDGVTVTAIGDYACRYRDNIESVTIPATVKTIGNGAFQNCSALETVIFEGNEAKIKYGSRVFAETLFMRSDLSEPYQRSKYYQKLTEVDLTGDYIADAFAIAASQDGYHEGNSFEEMDGSNSKGTGDYAEPAYFTSAPSYKWWPYETDHYQYGGWCGNYCEWCLAMASMPEEIHGWWKMKESEYPRWSDTVYAGGSMGYTLKPGDALKMEGGHLCLVTNVRQEGDTVYVDTWNGNHENVVVFETYELRASDGYNSGYARDYPSKSQDYGKRYQVKYIIPYLPEKLSEVKLYNLTFDPNGGTLPKGKNVKRLASSSYYGIMPVPQKEDSRFMGWFTEPEGGKKIGAYRKYLQTTDQTLYAHWEAMEHDEGSGSGLDPLPHTAVSETIGSAWFVKGQSYDFRVGEWQNGDTKIASVSKTGLITAKKQGTTVLKWTSPSGEHVDMTVIVAEIAMSQKSMKLLVGEKSEPLEVVFKGASPEHYSVSFTSSNPAVASVDETGTVTGVGKGSATIYGWSGGRSVACKVSVTDNAASLNPKKLSFGSGISLGAFQTCSPKYVTSDGRAFKAKNATWGWSDDPNAALEDIKDMTPVESKGKIKGYTNGIVEIDASNGKLKAVGPGTTTIFGIEKVDSPSLDNITKLTVTVRAVPTQSTIYVPAGKTVAVKFAGVKNDKAEWSITDIDGEPGCITLEQKNGKYTGKVKTTAGMSGSAEVTCKYEGFTWKSVVCAENPVLSSSEITLSDDSVIDIRGVYQKLFWKSGNPYIVFVDESGNLIIRGVGQTTLQTKIGGKNVKLTVTVKL